MFCDITHGLLKCNFAISYRGVIGFLDKNPERSEKSVRIPRDGVKIPKIRLNKLSCGNIGHKKS